MTPQSSTVFWPRMRLNGEILIRVIADALMVNTALFLALGLCSLALVDIRGSSIGNPPVVRLVLSYYQRSAWLLTLVSTTVFSLSGFYTRGRAYRHRYKVVVVLQAVSLTHLILGFVAFLIPRLVSVPRSALLLSWFFTGTMIVGARMVPMLWNSMAREERGRSLAKVSDAFGINGKVENILVTGGAGYLGSALTERLLELGYRVRVLDCLLYGEHALRKVHTLRRFELMRGDFRDVDTVVKAAQGMDAVVHLGAIVGDPACALDTDLTVDINYRATQTIAEVCKGFGIQRFVFASTCSVYGASDELLDERSILRPLSLYALTKLESEKLLLGLADGLFSPIILRFATIYGLSHRPRFDLVVNLLTAKAVQDGEVGIYGGKQWRPFVHVKDVAEAIVLSLQAPLATVGGQVFNVGSNEQNHQIAELGQLLQEAAPTARVITQPQEDDRNYRVCFDKIHNVLNFEPQYTVRDGIQEIMAAFASGRIVDYTDPYCSNCAYLKQNGHLRQALLAHQPEEQDWLQLSPAN